MNTTRDIRNHFDIISRHRTISFGNTILRWIAAFNTTDMVVMRINRRNQTIRTPKKQRGQSKIGYIYITKFQPFRLFACRFSWNQRIDSASDLKNGFNVSSLQNRSQQLLVGDSVVQCAYVTQNTHVIYVDYGNNCFIERNYHCFQIWHIRHKWNASRYSLY